MRARPSHKYRGGFEFLTFRSSPVNYHVVLAYRLRVSRLQGAAHYAPPLLHHALLAEMTGSAVLQRELERVIGLPFASPSSFVISQANSAKSRDMLIIAQDQHRQVLMAIEQREGSRAEAIMREHSRIAQRNLNEAMRSPDLQLMPSVRMIRRKT